QRQRSEPPSAPGTPSREEKNSLRAKRARKLFPDLGVLRGLGGSKIFDSHGSHDEYVASTGREAPGMRAIQAVQSPAPHSGHVEGNGRHALRLNSRAQRRQRNTFGVMCLNANIPKNTATPIGSTIMTSTSRPSGRPGASTRLGYSSSAGFFFFFFVFF